MPLLSFASPPQRFVIGNPALSIEDSLITVRLALTVDSEDGLRDMLKDGAVLSLGIGIKVERVRSWWANEGIDSSEFVSTILHDPLTRDFLIIMPGADGEKQNRDKNLTRLLYSTWQKLVIPVMPLDALRDYAHDSAFMCILDIRLQHTGVPPWLEQSLVFWSSNVVPGETIALPFRLPAGQE